VKRGDRVTFVPPWTHSRDVEHPDRETGVITQLNEKTAKVRIVDRFTREKRVDHCHLRDLVPA
jgi:hypothetical protein